MDGYLAAQPDRGGKGGRSAGRQGEDDVERGHLPEVVDVAGRVSLVLVHNRQPRQQHPHEDGTHQRQRLVFVGAGVLRVPDGEVAFEQKRGHYACECPKQEYFHAVAVVADVESPEDGLVEGVARVAEEGDDHGLGRTHSAHHREQDHKHGNGAADGLAQGEVLHVSDVAGHGGAAGVAVLQHAGEADVLEVAAQAGEVGGVGQFDAVPKFF